MSQIDRLVVSRGPALVTFGGGSFFSKEDIVVDLSKDTKEIPSSAFGPLTEIVTGRKASTKFTPVGEFEHLDVLWTPFADMVPGTSLFGAADSPLVIKPLDPDQKMVTFHAAAVMKPPGLVFTTQDTLIGEVEFEMIGANDTPVDNANYLFTFASNDIDPDALPYDPDNLLIQPYAAQWLSAGTWHPAYNGDDTTSAIAFDADAAAVQTALRTITALSACTVTGSFTAGFTVTNGTALNPALWTCIFASFPGGSSLKATTVSADVNLLRLYPWASFNSREGIKVTFDTQTTEDKSDAIGHYDTIFRSLSVKAALIPQGILDEDAMNAAAIQGTQSVVGSRLIDGAHDFIITGTGVYFQLYSANIRKAGLVYSSEKQRVPEFEWVASRSVAGGGALNPLFYIGAAAP
jgi:hypothetical protein